MERAWANGESRPEVARRYGVSKGQFLQHFLRGHVKRDMRAARNITAGGSLITTLEEYRVRIDNSLATLDMVLKNNTEDPGIVLSTVREQMAAIREATRLLELNGKLTGELDQSKYNIFIMGSWAPLRDALLDVLEQFPEAKMAVLNALKSRVKAQDMERALPAPEVIETEAEVIADAV